MKKSTLFFVFAALTGLLLSSCSSFRDLSIEKRRYNKGFHVSVRDQKTNHETAVAANAQVKAAMQQEECVPQAIATTEAPGNISSVNAIEKSKPAGNAWAAQRATKNNESASPSRAEVRKAVKAAVKNKSVSQEKNSAPASDTNTILLVILAILLPPVAVLIYENGLTNKFWISLLLTILLLLPGIIYSILVVTGTI